jgi:transposase InsO family protein
MRRPDSGMCWRYRVSPHSRLLTLGIKISMSDKGCPTQNGIAERFMRTLKEGTHRLHRVSRF